MKSKYIVSQFIVGALFGGVIACSPTKFTSSTPATSVCDNATTSCVVEQGYVTLTKNFEVGAGKVDILFISDNSASMSIIQDQLARKFSGFIQNLDAKKIDYRVAITTTDLAAVQSKALVTFGNGKTYLSNADADRINLFNTAIRRPETLKCESFISTMFSNLGPSFQSNQDYATGYPQVCASADTRGIATGFTVVANNTDSFLRSDANLNVILISNDDVRQGRYATDSNYALTASDSAQGFADMMNRSYPSKYWDFNSIIVKDAFCQQQQVLRTYQGQVVVNTSNLPAVSGGIGLEYARLSNMAARDIDNQPRPRGQVLDLCQDSYAQYFAGMATQITEAARQITLTCNSVIAPVVTQVANPSASVPFTWDGANKITFGRGSEGIPVSVKYKCYTGPK